MRDSHTRLEDRPHHRDGLSTAPPGEDRSPGDSPGPPGRHGPRSHVELFKSRSNKNNMEREKARITAPPLARRIQA